MSYSYAAGRAATKRHILMGRKMYKGGGRKRRKYTKFNNVMKYIVIKISGCKIFTGEGEAYGLLSPRSCKPATSP